jgi:hypothetical protein
LANDGFFNNDKLKIHSMTMKRIFSTVLLITLITGVSHAAVLPMACAANTVSTRRA